MRKIYIILLSVWSLKSFFLLFLVYSSFHVSSTRLSKEGAFKWRCFQISSTRFKKNKKDSKNNKDNTEYKPTKKGIAVNPKILPEVVEMMVRAAEEIS